MSNEDEAGASRNATGRARRMYSREGRKHCSWLFFYNEHPFSGADSEDCVHPPVPNASGGH